jgi:predicted alpha/beta-hydrolase family hydrolase
VASIDRTCNEAAAALPSLRCLPGVALLTRPQAHAAWAGFTIARAAHARVTQMTQQQGQQQHRGAVSLTLQPAAGTKTKATATVKEVEVALQLPCGVAAGASQALCALLCPAAGGRMDDGLLPAVALALAAAGVPSLRYTCAGANLSHRVAVTAALLRAAAPGGSGVLGLGPVSRWVGVGSSMGCRVVCALLAPEAAHPAALAAGALLSYPLVGTAKGDSRAAALVAVAAPLLLVRGTRDAYTPQPAWDEALASLRSEAHAVHELDGGDHGLKVAGGKAANEAARGRVLDALVAFVCAQQQPQAGGGGGEAGQETAGAPAQKRRKQR